MVIKDAYGYYRSLEDQLQAAGSVVQVIDHNDELNEIEANVVIHMSSLNNGSLHNYEYDSIRSLQKITKHFSIQKDTKVIVVTNGANAVQQNEQVNLGAAMLVGVLRTIQNEYSSISFHQVDLSNKIQKTTLSKIPDLVFADNKYKELVIRDEKIVTSILQKSSDYLPVKSILPNVTYVVTGGNNGLGLETVKWLSKKGATHICIISRSGLNNNAQSTINELEKNNVRITSYLADVSHELQLENVLEQIMQQQPVLKGVFHAAGILDDSMFENLTKEKFEHALYAKATGAWNLHQLLMQEKLDFFVVFSSGASVLGTAGQSNYAAANAFLDGLISHRRNNNCSGLSVNWGTVSDIGLAAQSDKRANRLKEFGIYPIHPDTLFAYFDKLFLSDAIQVAAIDIRFSEWIESNPNMRDNYFYSTLLNKNENNNSVEHEVKPGIFANVGEAIKYVKEQIKRNIASVTKMHLNKIKEDDTFKSYGLDSLLALQIKNKLQKDLNISLNITAIWSYPTVNKLSDFIVNESGFGQQNKLKHNPVQKNGHVQKSIEEEVRSLSTDELLKQLNEKINN